MTLNILNQKQRKKRGDILLNMRNELNRKFNLEAKKEFLIKQIIITNDMIGVKTSNLDKVIVDGGKHENKNELLILKKCDMELELQHILRELANIDSFIREVKIIADAQGYIYGKVLDLREQGTTIANISRQLYVSIATVNRLLKEMGLTKK